MSTISKPRPRLTARAFRHVALAAAAVIFAFPFVWMFCGIFKTNDEIWRTPYRLLPASLDCKALFENLSALGLGRSMANSLFVGVAGTLSTLAVSSLFAYAAVFLRNRWTDFLFRLVLLTYMLPAAVTYVPSYVILARLGLLNTHTGLIFSYLANVFSVFYLRQAFRRVNKDFIDAARIDGSSEAGILARVIVPLNVSSLSSIGMLTFIGLYNSYMWPSVMLSRPEKYLISQGLRLFFIQDGAYGLNWGQIMLACAVALLPIIVLFLAVREWFLSSIAEDSGVKS